MYRSLTPLVAVGFAVLISCSQHAPMSQKMSLGVDLFYSNQLDSAYKSLNSVMQSDPRNAQCSAYLAETARRLDRQQDAIYHAYRTLQLDACNSFAHTVLAEVYNPIHVSNGHSSFDSVWTHAQAAISCDSTDGNAWLVIWTEAIRRGDRDWENRALAALDHNNFFSPGIIEYNRWVLETLPPDAILLTNGDLDTYPAVMLQSSRNLRPDVAIVNLSLMNTAWYPHYIATRYDLPLPVPDSVAANLKPYQSIEGEVVTIACQKVEGWAARIADSSLQRPLTPALTVYNKNLSPHCRRQLALAGAYFRFDPTLTQPQDDPEAVRRAFDSARLDLYQGNMASLSDRSPIRRMSSVFPALNLCTMGINICRHQLEQGDRDGAREYLNKTKALATATGQLAHFSEQFKELEKLMQG